MLAATSREYLAENALNPIRFPSLARLEWGAANMVSTPLHGPVGISGVTSGGTESIFVAVSLARTVARERGMGAPEIVTGQTGVVDPVELVRGDQIELIQVTSMTTSTTTPNVRRHGLTPRTISSPAQITSARAPRPLTIVWAVPCRNQPRAVATSQTSSGMLGR